MADTAYSGQVPVFAPDGSGMDAYDMRCMKFAPLCYASALNRTSSMEK